MKHRNWKKNGIISSVIAIILILLIIIIPRLINLNRYNHLIVAQVERAAGGGEVALGRISWGISGGIWLNINGFSIRGASSFPGDLELSRIYAHVSIPPLLKKKIVLDKLLLDVASVNVRLGPDGAIVPGEPLSEEQQPLKSEEKESGKESMGPSGVPTAVDSEQSESRLPFEIEVEQVSIHVARFELDDSLTIPGKRQVHVYRDMEMNLDNILSGKDVSFGLSMQRGGAEDLDEFQVQGTFSGLTDSLKLENPGLRLMANVAGLKLDAVKPYIKNNDLEKQLSGSVSMELEYEGDLKENHLVTGRIDFGKAAYSNPALFETPLPGIETSLTFRIKLDPSEAAMEKLEVNFGNLLLDARALIRNWAKDPVIQNAELSFNIPLAEVSPLVPWELLGERADVVRKICEKGGHINLDRALLPDIQLARLSDDPTALIKNAKVTADYQGITLPLVSMLPDIEAETGRLILEDGALSLEETRTRIGPLSLPLVSARATDITDSPKVVLTASGPVQVAATSDDKIETFLKQYGLKSVTGLAEIDMRAVYDHREPGNWTADGLLALKGLRAEAHPSAVVLDGLQGDVTFSRKKSMNLTFRDISASINQAPVRLSGEVTDIGTTDMLFDVDVYGRQLDLAQLGEFLPVLKENGLRGTLTIDLDAHVPYDAPAESRVNGTVSAREVEFQLAAYDLTVENGVADLTLNGNGADIEKISLRANGQTVALSGNIVDIGTPEMLISAKVYGEQLDITRLTGSVPALADLDIGGILDVDLDAYVPYATPEKSRLNGSVSTRDARVRLAASNLIIENGSADLTLDGNAIDIEKLTVHVNDQEIALSGRVSDPVNPKAKLLISSPDLNLDRLLVRDSADEFPLDTPPDKNEQQGEGLSAGQKSGNTEMPPMARNLTADLQIESGMVKYSGTQFENLIVMLLYQDGVVDSYDINFNMDEGAVAAKGFADLRNLNRIPFAIKPDISDLRLEKIVPVLGMDELPLDGPLSLEGQLEGNIGATEEVIAGLEGGLNAEVGPGTLYNVGRIGNLLAKIFSIKSIKGIFSGRTIDNLASEGLPFQSLTARTTFDNGTLNLESLDFKSDTLDAVSQGTIDFVNREMMVSADLIPFSVVDKTLGFIPVAGDTAQSLTQIHLEIEGSLSNPEIKSTQMNRLIEDMVKEPVDIIKGVGKGLKKLIPKSDETESAE